MTERGPLQIIADLLPQGPDTWISDRHDMAMEILMALNREGFGIHARNVRILYTTRKPFMFDEK